MRYHSIPFDTFYDVGSDTYYLNPLCLTPYSRPGDLHKTFASRREAEAYLVGMGLRLIPSYYNKAYVAFTV